MLLLIPTAAMAQTVTETWTHADTVGNISADLQWVSLSNTSGPLFSIVSNQAVASGGASTSLGDTQWPTISATSTSMTIQATMVQISRPTPNTHNQSCIHALLDTNNQSYMYCARIDETQGSLYFLGKSVAGVFTPLIHHFNATIVPNTVMALVIDRTANTVTGNLNGVQDLTASDSALQGSFRAGISYLSTDPAASTTFDNWSITPAVPLNPPGAPFNLSVH